MSIVTDRSLWTFILYQPSSPFGGTILHMRRVLTAPVVLYFLRGTMQKDMSHETESPIKLLVIDIDGTLLNPDGEITLAVQAAIQAARQAGIIVTLATARRYCNTIQIADALGLDIPLIMYDGAMIVQHPQRVILHKNLLPARVGQQAVDLMVHHHLPRAGASHAVLKAVRRQTRPGARGRFRAGRPHSRPLSWRLTARLRLE